jgi:hypothetical protein
LDGSAFDYPTGRHALLAQGDLLRSTEESRMTYHLTLEEKEITVPTLEKASERFVEARDRLGWQARDLAQGIPVFDEWGKRVADVGYNGRVWSGINDWRSGIKPLYDPLPPVDSDWFTKQSSRS